MRRRFIADTFSPATGHPTRAALTGEQAAHLARVLRAQPGQVYDIVANGFLHRAEITAVSDAEVVFTLQEELEADAALPIHLLLAIFKFDHFEWAIEKATELGVARITPILARRTEKHLALAAETSPIRILLSETEQSLSLATALGAPHLAPEMWDRSATNLALAIGPEGGWTPEEMSLFTAHAWTHVTLGPRILRAETAAIAAIAIAAAAMTC